MSPKTNDHVPMTVWCTLIPPEEMRNLVGFEEELRSVNQTYEDWLVSMRGKSLVGSDVGVLLDRIRMLMINIGIACGMNREAAEEIQTILSTSLRKRSLDLVAELPDEPPEKLAVKETLTAFFSELQFTRDIFPEEDIGKVTPEKVARSGKKSRLGKLRGSSKNVDQQKVSAAAVLASSNILKRIYMRLLSPDPWGEY